MSEDAAKKDGKASGQLGLKELIAMGVGGMIGGGIFSVMGLAVQTSGHAAPLAFALGGVIAFVAGYSYIKLALVFRSDGASFTYLEKAFPRHQNVGGIAGWTILVGYIGTLSLYAFTFGAYGANLLGVPDAAIVRMVLSASAILLFMLVNLHGASLSGDAEDLVVYSKIILLSLLAVAGLTAVSRSNLTPVFDDGFGSIFIAGALVFVAFEGFELITNAVAETGRAEHNVPRGVYGAIAIVVVIYVTLTIVGIGGMSLQKLIDAKEYALAVAAEPALGHAGSVLVSIAALLATSSAINATMFGAARMMAEMTRSDELPEAFSFRNREHVPWVAVVALAVMALALTLLGKLETIASFSSMTFLLVSIGVLAANWRLREKTESRAWIIAVGLILLIATVATLVVFLWETKRSTLYGIGGIYLAVVVMELAFSERRVIFRRNR